MRYFLLRSMLGGRVQGESCDGTALHGQAAASLLTLDDFLSLSPQEFLVYSFSISFSAMTLGESEPSPDSSGRLGVAMALTYPLISIHFTTKVVGIGTGPRV